MNEPDIKQYLDRPFSVLAIVFASPIAQGARPIAARGAFYSCRCTLEVSTVGNITIVISSITIALTGMLSGTLVATEVDVFYPNGNLLVSISGTFSGTVAGQSGTAEISGTGGPITRGNGTGTLDWVIGQGDSRPRRPERARIISAAHLWAGYRALLRRYGHWGL